MNKKLGLKSALVVLFAAGILCACGESERAGKTPEAWERGRFEEEPNEAVAVPMEIEPTEAATAPMEEEPSPAAVGVQTPDEGKVFTEKIESVSIRYYIGYNITTGDAISDSIPCFEIEVTGDDLDTLAEGIGELTKLNLDLNSEKDQHIIYDHMRDYYELTINGDFVIVIGDEYGNTTEDYGIFEVPAEICETVERLVQENNEQNVYETLGGKKISVTDQNGHVWDVKDDEVLDHICSQHYYVVYLDDNDFGGERVAYTVDLHNGERLEVHFASVLGRLCHADGSYDYVFIGDLEDYLDKVFP